MSIRFLAVPHLVGWKRWVVGAIGFAIVAVPGTIGTLKQFKRDHPSRTAGPAPAPAAPSTPPTSPPSNPTLHPSSKADLVASFVEPDDLELVISNTSHVTAENPTFQAYLVDLDAQNQELLPIRRETGDFLRGKSSFLRIPLMHYDSNAVLQLVHPGDRIFGFLSLTCSNCKTIRWYWVYYTYAKGGWFKESASEPDVKLFHEARSTMAEKTKSVDDFISPKGRREILPTVGIVRYPEQGTLH